MGLRLRKSTWSLPPPSLQTVQSLHIAGNIIGDSGCFALSSSLIHLSHLRILDLNCEFLTVRLKQQNIWDHRSSADYFCDCDIFGHHLLDDLSFVDCDKFNYTTAMMRMYNIIGFNHRPIFLPFLTHCSQLHRGLRLHCALDIFDSSFPFGTTESRQWVETMRLTLPNFCDHGCFCCLLLWLSYWTFKFGMLFVVLSCFFFRSILRIG